VNYFQANSYLAMLSWPGALSKGRSASRLFSIFPLLLLRPFSLCPRTREDGRVRLARGGPISDYGTVGERRRTEPNESNPTPSGRRLTVHDAARALGISEDAVRMRVKRGTLEAEREGGRLYVLLTPDPTTEPTADPRAELVDELRDRVRYLEGIVSTRDDEIRRRDVIISQLTDRIPAIEAPQEPPESPTAATEQPGRVEPQPAVEGTPEGTERRSWWQRMFK
jgi:hypothetical protein